MGKHLFYYLVLGATTKKGRENNRQGPGGGTDRVQLLL